MEVLTAQLGQQAARIQKVSAQLEASKTESFSTIKELAADFKRHGLKREDITRLWTRWRP
jgi:hypothetical protein